MPRDQTHRGHLRMAAGLALFVGTSAAMADSGPIVDVRPLLSDRCFLCHGPDATSRVANLRLDRMDDQRADRARGAAVVPGDAAASAIMKRLRHPDPDHRMPPADAGKPLTEAEIASVAAWIDAGAPWPKHWAFADIAPPAPPAGADHPIDGFLTAQRTNDGLTPAPPAPATTRLRRATLDLTGLPPTMEELDAFLADDAPDAWERAIDGLLAKPAYGEHQARHWLDAARYGDTHGLHLDNQRVMWPYRDWVIRAFNDNLPFDDFTVQQLAGDLLPEPTLNQQIASGFVRCHVTTSEGGAIADEYLVKYAVDRVETVSTIWLGLTAGCAACHDHKYDPISQREFYELYAFFNNTTEAAMDGNAAAPPPVIRVPSAEQSAQVASYDAAIETLEAARTAAAPAHEDVFTAWYDERTAALAGRWSDLEITAAAGREGTTFTTLDDGSLLAGAPNPDTEVYEITAHTPLEDVRGVRLETLTHPDLPKTGPGRWAANGNFVLSEIEIDAAPLDPALAPDATAQTVRLVAAHPDHEQTDYPAHTAVDGAFGPMNGWAILGDDSPAARSCLFVADQPFGFPGGTTLTIRLHFVSKWKQHSIGRLRLAVTNDPDALPMHSEVWHTAGPIVPAEGANAFATALGTEPAVDTAAPFAEGHPWTARPELLDGTTHILHNKANAAYYLTRTIDSASARRVRFALGSDDGIRVWLNGTEIHTNDVPRGVAPNQDVVEAELAAGTNTVLLKIANRGGPSGFFFEVHPLGGGEPTNITALLARAEPTGDERTALRNYHRDSVWPEGVERAGAMTKARADQAAYAAMIPTTLVAHEREMRRPAYILKRGQYDQRGDVVEPGVPACLPPFDADRPQNRLGFAQWLVDPDHPLTARVTVNRVWQQYFGTGLVRTAGDFGSQGERPSHPQLLDFLARAFVDSGWDVKALHKLIVTSAAYQAAADAPESRRADPENRLVARGPRYRLDAEVIRDQALALSGLLVETVGGPPVRPYQPDGLWKAVAYVGSNTQSFKRDSGDGLFRRSLYTFWKRTSPPPAMTTLDAPSRETCVVRRERTNTPLAALLLLNDEQFVEAARHFGSRILAAGSNDADRIAWGFRRATARAAHPDELAILQGALDDQRAAFRAAPDAALALLAVGATPRDETLDPTEYAAWTMLANLLLNLDEVLTKG